jgi:hypothetical protein
MAIASVLQWLSDPNRTYHHGKLLYEQYGNNIVSSTIINTGHQGSNYHFTFLENCLKELADHTPEKMQVAIPQLETFTVPDKPGISDQEYKKLPEDMKSIRKDAKNQYNRAKWLFARIPLTDSKEQRLEMALQLLDDFDENRRQMGHVQGFLEKGTYTPETIILKELKPVEDLSIKELIAESKNIPTYVTKDIKRIKDVPVDTDRFKELTSRIKARKERLEQVNRRLNQ